jgi:hypothetical protein
MALKFKMRDDKNAASFFGRNKSIHNERGWENLSAPFPTIATQVKHAPTLNKGVKKIFIAFWFETPKKDGFSWTKANFQSEKHASPIGANTLQASCV